MQAGKPLQMLAVDPFFAAITGMALEGKLSIDQPTAQRFGIDAEATTSVDHRHKGHENTPFVWCMEQERERARQTPRSCPGKIPRKTPKISQMAKFAQA
jgi:hypothetical protein